MTLDDIIRMALESEVDYSGTELTWESVIYKDEQLIRFANLVAAAEREACAAMAEAFHRHQYDFTGDLELHEAIRARGNRSIT